MIKIVLIILALLYALNPYDILPDFLVGWGWIDDIVILGLLWRFLYSQKKKQSLFKDYFKQNQGYSGDQFHRDDSGDHKNGPDSQFRNKSDIWDPYRVLGLEKGVSQEEIKRAYRQLANKYHPDKVEHLGPEFRELAEIRFKDIQKAYQELSGN
jgi:DnaJ like chaperone protein